MNSFRLLLAAIEAAPDRRRMQMNSIGGGLFARHVQQLLELYHGGIWLE